jgi:hypothetical protein
MDRRIGLWSVGKERESRVGVRASWTEPRRACAEETTTSDDEVLEGGERRSKVKVKVIEQVLLCCVLGRGLE